VKRFREFSQGKMQSTKPLRSPSQHTRTGILRLRDWSASRTSSSAQDDPAAAIAALAYRGPSTTRVGSLRSPTCFAQDDSPLAAAAGRANAPVPAWGWTAGGVRPYILPSFDPLVLGP